MPWIILVAVHFSVNLDLLSTLLRAATAKCLISVIKFSIKNCSFNFGRYKWNQWNHSRLSAMHCWYTSGSMQFQSQSSFPSMKSAVDTHLPGPQKNVLSGQAVLKIIKNNRQISYVGITFITCVITIWTTWITTFLRRVITVAGTVAQLWNWYPFVWFGADNFVSCDRHLALATIFC